MFGRLWVRLLVLLAFAVAAINTAVVTGAVAAGAVEAPRIVAIGDLHGDFVAWREIARHARLIDEKGRWTGGTTVLVQAGDVADRGPDTRLILLDLMRLQREAARAGGQVIMLVGNHEAMNMTGDLRYVSAGEYAAFVDRKSLQRRTQFYERNLEAIEQFYRNKQSGMTSEAIRQAWVATMPLGMIEHQLAWSSRGEIGKWMVTNPAVVLLGGNLFVHAGLSAAYATRTIADINAGVAAALASRDTAETAIINDPAGPLWYRGLARGSASAAASGEDLPAAAPPVAPPPLTVAAELDAVLKSMGAQRLVIAHTPHKPGILIEHDGRLVRIDTGISAAYGGQIAYLEIIGDRLVPHALPRPAADVVQP